MYLVDERTFEDLVAAALDTVPAAALDELDNVAIFVEDEPEDGSDILGVYEGVALTERPEVAWGMPDRIVLYRLPHCAAVDDADQLRVEIRVTLMHEIGHYFGIDEDRLHELGWQ